MCVGVAFEVEIVTMALFVRKRTVNRTAEVACRNCGSYVQVSHVNEFLAFTTRKTPSDRSASMRRHNPRRHPVCDPENAASVNDDVLFQERFIDIVSTRLGLLSARWNDVLFVGAHWEFGYTCIYRRNPRPRSRSRTRGHGGKKLCSPSENCPVRTTTLGN